MENPSERSLVVVGAGRIGASLARDLSDRGAADSITVFVRNPAMPVALLDAAHIRRAGLDAGSSADQRVSGVDTAVFCVPDDALRGAARAWAERVAEGRLPPARHALHTSGAHVAAALAPLRADGSSIASWHPLVALAEPGRGRFAGVTFGIEGEAAAVEEATRLTAVLGARALPVRPEAKALYHLAAVFGSNYLVACLSVAARLLGRAREAGGPDSAPDTGDLLEALMPLARSALENVDARGLPRGVTGPIVRGDIGTIRRHLEALDPAARDLYRALGAELLRMRSDELPHAVRARLWRELRPGGDRPFGIGEEVAHDE